MPGIGVCQPVVGRDRNPLQLGVEKSTHLKQTRNLTPRLWSLLNPLDKSNRFCAKTYLVSSLNAAVPNPVLCGFLMADFEQDIGLRSVLPCGCGDADPSQAAHVKLQCLFRFVCPD